MQENGYSKEDLISLAESAISNLEKDLHAVTEGYPDIKPVEVQVSTESFYEQLEDWEKKTKRQQVIAERLALPEKERLSLEAVEQKAIQDNINLWEAVLYQLTLNNEENPQGWKPPKRATAMIDNTMNPDWDPKAEGCDEVPRMSDEEAKELVKAITTLWETPPKKDDSDSSK